MAKEFRVQAVVLRIGSNSYGFATRAVATDTIAFRGFLQALPSVTTTMGNLESGGLVSNDLTIILRNPIRNNGCRLIPRTVNLILSRNVLVEFYEMTGTELELRTFANWTLLLKGQVKFPIARYITGMETNEVKLQVEFPLSQFGNADIKVTSPKVLGEATVPCTHDSTSSSHYTYKVCEGPIASVDSVSINGSAQIYLGPEEIWEDYGVIRIPREYYEDYFYEDEFSDNVVTAQINGYVDTAGGNDDHASRKLFEFGDRFSLDEWNVLGATVSQTDSATTRLTAAGSNARLSYNYTYGSLYGVPPIGKYGTHYIYVRYKYISGTSGGNMSMKWKTTFLQDYADSPAIDLGAVDTTGSYVDLYVNVDGAVPDLGGVSGKKRWFRELIQGIEFNFEPAVDASPIVLDIQKIALVEKDQTTSLRAQMHNLFTSHTEFMGNVLKDMMGVAEFPTGSGATVLDPANGWGGDYYHWGTSLPAQSVALHRSTEYILSVRHSLLKTTYAHRYGVRCWVKIQNTDNSKYYSDARTWESASGDDQKIFLNVVDPTEYNQSMVRFTTENAVGPYEVTVGYDTDETYYVHKDALGNPSFDAVADTAARSLSTAFVEGASSMIGVGDTITPSAGADQGTIFPFVVQSLAATDKVNQIRKFTLSRYPFDSTASQIKSTSQWAEDDELVSSINVATGLVNLRTYLPVNEFLGTASKFDNDTKVFKTSRYLNADSSLGQELTNLYQETGVFVYPNVSNTVEPLLVSKSMYEDFTATTDAATVVTTDIVDYNDLKSFEILGDQDRTFFNYYVVEGPQFPVDGDFGNKVSVSHREDTGIIMKKSYQALWLRSRSQMKLRGTNILNYMDTVGDEDVTIPFSIRDIGITIGERGNDFEVGSRLILKIERPVEGVQQDVYIPMLVKEKTPRRYEGKDESSMVLSSLFSGLGFMGDGDEALNSFVRKYGNITVDDLDNNKLFA